MVIFDVFTGAHMPDQRETALADVARVIDKAHALGMDVALKPHIISRATGISMNDWVISQVMPDQSVMNKVQILQGWHDYLVHVANLAQQKGAAFIFIGAENNLLDIGHRESRLLEKVRHFI